ncbi:adenylate/guanylate cyclase domain-containing protein [Mesorhizobium sp. L-8-3]|uniref:adenylate/guanylate cyclase domain-containing protein n=1 Tax=Mesorhizobium sp. L-8-3 TaxID=2744522 RepID=UPI001925F8A8|nr:adenylate/guanylate cyclase domain-containing protein [Mesorhizobium sp. L-8-3]BCH25978.1 guanylyl cyclase [Mesorhizobium sp. L-8-3]
MDRRLAAVLIADVVGYGRLSQADEEGTRARFQADLREVFEPRIAAHHGRLVKTMGDGLLVEFPSVVDAVRCAVEVQRAKSERNFGVAADRRLVFRVGVNLGDVILEDDDIHGDGVIIADRLQSLADPGGVMISGSAFDQTSHKADVGFACLGEQRVKNIADPVRVYRVLLDPAAAGKVIGATPNAGARPLILGAVGALVIAAVAALLVWQWIAPPNRPSLAVLPFANLSGDPGEEYFADGITDDLITDLAQLAGLVVIARNSVFTYKGRPVVLRDVARDLDVRYVVEGSVRRSGDRIHVNAKLIDTATGDHLVAKEFDRSAADVFAIEDEVVRHIVEALGVRPTAAEQEQIARPPTTNLEAYDYYLRGEQAERTGLFREALQFYAKATMLDPAFADAYAADARSAVDIWRNVFDDILPGPVARKRAYEKAGRALELNPESSRPYAILAGLQVVDRRYEEALVSARRAVALGPSDSEAHAVLSLVLTFSGRHADAVAAIESAQKFNPNLSMSERQVAGMAFLLHGDYVRAIETLERARAEALRGEVGISGLLAAAYARAGRLSEARAVAAEARRTTPLISIELWRVQYAHFRNGQDLERVLDAMREAGIPQWPFDFRGDDRDRLKGEDISRLALGRTWRGQTEAGESALLQFGRDGKTAFRTPTQIVTGTAFVDRDMLCEQSENVLLGRPRCGPVYRRTHGAGEPAYTYVNVFTVFHFSPVE